jgi:uncharacterized protein YprB with RNaseH-like and TPR domain
MVIYFDIETTGLNPYRDKILTIQVKKGDEINLWTIWEENDELIMIKKFLAYIEPIFGSESIIGYNCLKFDVPFIHARLNKYDAMDANAYELLHNKKWIDLYQFQGDNYISMDRWLDAYGIERQCPYSGRDIPWLYKEKMYKEIEEHAVDDLIVCEHLVQKLKQLYPDVF